MTLKEKRNQRVNPMASKGSYNNFKVTTKSNQLSVAVVLSFGELTVKIHFFLEYTNKCTQKTVRFIVFVFRALCLFESVDSLFEMENL